jgi:hypothetical protein
MFRLSVKKMLQKVFPQSTDEARYDPALPLGIAPCEGDGAQIPPFADGLANVSNRPGARIPGRPGTGGERLKPDVGGSSAGGTFLVEGHGCLPLLYRPPRSLRYSKKLITPRIARVQVRA